MATSLPAVPQPRDTTYLLSCRVVQDKSDHSAQMPMRRNADLALDHLEDACPALFQPRRPRTEYSADGGLRRYIGTDLTAWVSHGSVKFLQPFGGRGRGLSWSRKRLDESSHSDSVRPPQWEIFREAGEIDGRP